MRIPGRASSIVLVVVIAAMVSACGSAVSSDPPIPSPSSLGSPSAVPSPRAAASPAAPPNDVAGGPCLPTADQPVGTIVTIAGTGEAGFSGDGGPATDAQVKSPMDVVVDAAGTVYVGDGNHRVRRIGPDGIVTTIAGTGEPGSSGDGGPAIGAQLDEPGGLALGSDGSLFVADFTQSRIRRIDPSGTITTIIGSGIKGTGGDGGPALDATIQAIHLALGPDGTLYFEDLNRFRAVTDGTIDAFAGTGTPGFAGDGGPAIEAGFGSVQGAAADAHGNVFLVDTGNLRIRKVDGDGLVSTVAGTGSSGSTGDGGPATGATFKMPVDLAVADDGAVYVSDYHANAVRRVGPDGTISTIAGGSGSFVPGDCGPAVEAGLEGPTGLAVRDGMLYIVERSGDRIRRVALED
jgi:hypothetical protein